MKFLQFERLRPKWTIRTLLLAVAWLSVVVRLNSNPRIDEFVVPDDQGKAHSINLAYYGYPWTYSAEGVEILETPELRLRANGFYYYWSLAGDVVVGISAVVVLTYISRRLLLRIASVLSKSTAR